ncbi:MAG: hypothetical protein HWE13_15680 [Gammaproteobacteria bacterium]|nr:hypothetical protein [Gammaproteobacteria bacterium]
MGEVVVRDGQDWITPGAFDISFVVIMDIDRDEEFDISELTYTINVDSVYAFKEYRYVLLIVEKRDDIFKLIDWQILRRFFCISEDLVPSERSEFYFKMQKVGYKKKLCRAL